MTPEEYSEFQARLEALPAGICDDVASLLYPRRLRIANYSTVANRR